MEKSMILIKSRWEVDNKPVETFRCIPISLECPYIECIYDPGTRWLAVISKNPKKSFTMTLKLNANGERIPVIDKGKIVGFKQERVLIDSYQEYYIEEKAAIYAFIGMFAVNADETADLVTLVMSPLEKEVPPGEITLADGKTTKEFIETGITENPGMKVVREEPEFTKE